MKPNNCEEIRFSGRNSIIRNEYRNFRSFAHHHRIHNKILHRKPRETSIFHGIGNPEILIGNLWVGTSPIARFGAHHRLRHRILHRHGTPRYFWGDPVACGDFARFGPSHSSLLNKRRYIIQIQL